MFLWMKNKMKYSITYECRSGGGVFQDSFEFESDEIPKPTDPPVIEFALKESAKFIKEGLGGLKIITIVSREK